ncbi:MAG: hypothetical protein ACI9NT_000413 [Bacteroidia bacterium]|jgi:hypothetical protein
MMNSYKRLRFRLGALHRVKFAKMVRSFGTDQIWSSRKVMKMLLTSVLFSLLASAPALGKEYRLTRNDQVVVIDMHFLMPASRRESVLSWLRFSTDALASVFGRWPRSEWRIEITPISMYSKDSIPWAQVNRGDPDTVAFYIDAMASERALVENWTTYHELSHLLIPYRGWGDLWFSEGLASYYQNLLQARSGVIDERLMWQKLHDGFERGRDNPRPDLNLAELSPNMRENRSFMRVYWSGAWYFLSADIALRKESGGNVTLDSALGMLNSCCRDRAMSAREIAKKLNFLTDSTLFTDLFARARASRAVPPVSGLFSDLGITIEDGTVSLLPDHAGSAIRRDIVDTE